MAKIKKYNKMIIATILLLSIAFTATGCDERVNDSVKTNSNIFYVSNKVEGKGGNSHLTSIKIGSLSVKNNPNVEMSFGFDKNLVTEILVYKVTLSGPLSQDTINKSPSLNITSTKKVNFNFSNIGDFKILNNTSGKIYIRTKYSSSAGGGFGWYYVNFSKEIQQSSASNPVTSLPSVNYNNKEISSGKGPTIIATPPSKGLPTGSIKLSSIPATHRATYYANHQSGMGSIKVESGEITFTNVLLDVAVTPISFNKQYYSIKNVMTVSASKSSATRVIINNIYSTPNGEIYAMATINFGKKILGIWIPNLEAPITMDININSVGLRISNVKGGVTSQGSKTTENIVYYKN
jgi:hypothetical protein